MSFRFIKSTRNANLLVKDNYIYRKKKVYNGVEYWTCCEQNCVGKVTIESSTIKCSTDHNHEPVLQKIIQIEQRNKGKEYAKVANYPNLKESYQKATNETLQTYSDDVVGSALQTFRSLKKTLSRARAGRYPPLPSTHSDIVVPNELKQNSNGEVFFRIADGENEKILLFATDLFLKFLCNAKHVYADGTFKSVPKLFHSLYSFHVMVNDNMIPVVYALLPSSTSETYIRMIRLVQNLCFDLQLTWSPEIFTTDFEMAAMKAIKTCFPTCTLKSCLFHFSQSIWRNVQHKGLTREYKENDEVYNTIKRLSALPFLKSEDIAGAFEEIIADSPQIDNLDDFILYFKTTYLIDDARFPISTWNHFNDQDQRTNNHVEGWHFALNKSVGRNHASLWLFLEKLIQHQNSSETNIMMAQHGAIINLPKKKYAEANQRILNLTFEYANGNLSPIQFIDKVKHYTKLSDSNRN